MKKLNNNLDISPYVRQKIFLMMKCIPVFLLMTFMSVSASTLGQKMVIRMNDVSLQSVFKEIKQKMGYTFVYNEEMVEQAGCVSVDINSDDIHQVMKECLKHTSLGYYLVVP